ncbi:MAG: hypothetical protein ACXVW8_07000 [Nocardioidaceae bacterium]
MDAGLKDSIDRLRESVDALRHAIEAAASDVGAKDSGDDLHRQLTVLSRLEQDGLISPEDYEEEKYQLMRNWPSS